MGKYDTTGAQTELAKIAEIVAPDMPRRQQAADELIAELSACTLDNRVRITKVGTAKATVSVGDLITTIQYVGGEWEVSLDEKKIRVRLAYDASKSTFVSDVIGESAGNALTELTNAVSSLMAGKMRSAG